MKLQIAPFALLFVLLFALSACLEPEDEQVDFSRRFGDPAIEPADAPHVEDNPALANNVAAFSRSTVYLNAFSEGDPIRYWNVDGPNATFIAPIFEIVGPDGPLGRTIIDVIPGDAGYTPWWRTVRVRTTAKYNGERIWSRDAIDAGIALGILEQPEETTEVRNLPVYLRGSRIPVDEDASNDVEPTWGWYRKQRVSWIDFSDRIEVPVGVREMPSFPVYVVQRLNNAQPIYEFVTDTDLNHDGDLDDTNNIFPSKPGGSRYSPLWYVAFVRTVADYPSIDTSSTAVGLKGEEEFLDANLSIIPGGFVVENGILEQRDFLVNCSIQRVRGEL
jgi:hypothetical protein